MSWEGVAGFVGEGLIITGNAVQRLPPPLTPRHLRFSSWVVHVNRPAVGGGRLLRREGCRPSPAMSSCIILGANAASV